ncbi:hypothetical protein NKH18_05900 [Streptomyces sp. M10(2022)]
MIAPTASGNKVIVSPGTGRRAGGRGRPVEVITPDADAKKAFGRNSLDPARREAAARAGLAQSAAHTEAVASVWSG